MAGTKLIPIANNEWGVALNYMHSYAMEITPAMAIKNVGVGSQFLIALVDKNGDTLDGSKVYIVRLPPNVPAKNSWSFTLYDNQTRSGVHGSIDMPVSANNGGRLSLFSANQSLTPRQ